MRDTLRRLLELEGLDGEIAKLVRAREEIPERRSVLQAEREARRERVGEARREVADLEHSERELEAALADTESLLTRLDGQQYEVTSRSAYEALRHEMDAARSAKSGHETAILELLESIDAGRKEMARLETEGAGADARDEEELAALEARDDELAASLEQVRARREECAAGTEAGALERYERVASHRRPAAVVVSGAACPACRIRIPPQHGMELRAGTMLLTCESCLRILVHESVAA